LPAGILDEIRSERLAAKMARNAAGGKVRFWARNRGGILGVRKAQKGVFLPQKRVFFGLKRGIFA
jgi:hypothetical protein